MKRSKNSLVVLRLRQVVEPRARVSRQLAERFKLVPRNISGVHCYFKCSLVAGHVHPRLPGNVACLLLIIPPDTA